MIAYGALQQQFSQLSALSVNEWVPVHSSVKGKFPDLGACTTPLKQWREAIADRNTRAFECELHCQKGLVHCHVSLPFSFPDEPPVIELRSEVLSTKDLQVRAQAFVLASQNIYPEH